MTDVGSAANPQSTSPGQPAASVGQEGGGWIGEADLLALLDRLGVPHSSAELHDDPETALALERDALQASEQAPTASPAWIAEHLPVGPSRASLLAMSSAADASDWDLPGIAASYRQLASWAQAGELAAVAQIASRAAAANPRIGTSEAGKPNVLPPEAAAEVGLELRMSQFGASTWVDLAVQLQWRLAATGAALAAGTIDLARARIIAEGTGALSDELAAAVEARVLAAAGGQTTGQLRVSVRRAVLAVDPDGAEQRRTETERRAKVSLYPGDEGTATLTGSCLPGVHAAAAMARVTAMARALKAGGAGGGIDLLRSHVFVGLLLGTLPLIPPPPGGLPDGPPPNHDPGGPSPTDGTGGNHPGEPGADERIDGPEDPAECPGGDDSPPVPWDDVPCPADKDAPPQDDRGLRDPGAGCSGSYGAGDTDEADRAAQSPSPDWPPLPAHLPGQAADTAQPDVSRGPTAGLLDILIPWSAITGPTFQPAQLGRIGPVTRLQARQLMLLAIRSPHAQWRVVLTDDDGRAIAAERARPTRRYWTGADQGNVTGTVGRVTITIRQSWLGTSRAGPPGCPSPFASAAATVLRAARRAAERARTGHGFSAAGCAHTQAASSYRPPPRLRDLIAIRDVTCRFNTCGQPAWRTDLDHTIPWHKGGLTCECNLGGFCRTHHKIKQLPGWRVCQPQPGIFGWRTPAGRTYLTQPGLYPV
jgi:hypothetical protein